jgi:predicted pyridoxine 5'-phosphate oxidase superfamily flavin-nucleotide-binding protein
VSEPSVSFPGSDAEYLAQELYGTRERADRFYRDQLVDVLTPRMQEFIAERTELVVSSVDPEGRPDTSVRFGDPGFVSVLDERTLAWPELRGNGVMTTVGNLLKNSAAHLMFLDRAARIGLHLRGHTRILEAEDMADEHPRVVAATNHSRGNRSRGPERWVLLYLATAYVHCRKHFPEADRDIAEGADDNRAKGGDYFGTKHTPKPWAP